MTYNGQISRMMSDYSASKIYSDNLERPEEFGLGVAYQAGGHAVAVDYKRIGWSKKSSLGPSSGIVAFSIEKWEYRLKTL